MYFKTTLLCRLYCTTGHNELPNMCPASVYLLQILKMPPSQPACYRPLFRLLRVLSLGHLILAPLPRTASISIVLSLKMLLRPLSWHKASSASGTDHTLSNYEIPVDILYPLLQTATLIPPSAILLSILILNDLQT